MKLMDRIKNFTQKAAADMHIGREYKDVFEIEGVPAFRQFYNFQIFPAKYIYRGLYNAWHLVEAPTIGNPKATRTLFRMDTAKAICAELAGLVWSEQAEVSVSCTGNETEEDPLGHWVAGILKDNAFYTKMQSFIEQGAALGGGALKAYVKVKRDANGNPIKGTEKIVIDYCMADQFVPTAWDNAKVTEGFFVSRKAKDGYYYTRLEWHSWDGDTYVIRNELFRSEEYKNDVGQDSQDILGIRYPLQAIYPELEPEVKINGLNKSLFEYWRTPIANNVDDNSPLGISIYGNSFDTLHGIDVVYDSLIREIRLGKKRIIVPSSAVKMTIDPQTGVERRYFDANDEAFEALAYDDPEKLKIQDNSSGLRIEEHTQALNALLTTLCMQVGFSSNTFSFDAKNGLKTATEVISENSKTYKTIKNFQDQLKPAIKGLIDNIISLGALYDMDYEGQPISRLAQNGYETSVTMEDAVLEDSGTKMAKGIQLMNNGVLSKKTFLTAARWGIGMTDEEAEQELKRVAKESRMTAETFDIFESGAIE